MEPIVADYVVEGVSVAFDQDLCDEEVEEGATKSSLCFPCISPRPSRNADMNIASAVVSDDGFTSRLKHWGWIRVVNLTDEPLVVYYRPTPFRRLQNGDLRVGVPGAVDVGVGFNMTELNSPFLTSSVIIGPPARDDARPPQKSAAGKIAVMGDTYVSVRRGMEPDPAKWRWDGWNMFVRRGQVITVEPRWTEPLHQTIGIVDGAAGVAN